MMEIRSTMAAVWALMMMGGGARGEIGRLAPSYVTEHAPMVWLHSDDPYNPSDILAHIQHTVPRYRKSNISEDDLPHDPLTLENLAELNNLSERVALTSKEDPLTHPAWSLGTIPDPDTGALPNATACAVILVEKEDDPAQVDAFYFYFYSYDEGGNITQVVEPLDQLVEGPEVDSGMHFGNHVGDWEHNMIRFRDGVPQGIYYSQHEMGMAYKWNSWSLSFDGNQQEKKDKREKKKKKKMRPLVYSARGSHANYPAKGDQVHSKALIDWCDEGRRWDPVKGAYFYKYDGKSKRFTMLEAPTLSLEGDEEKEEEKEKEEDDKDIDNLPRDQTLEDPVQHNLTSWLYYTGLWGDFQYPESDPRQLTIPRFGIHRFNSGPTGPRFKQLIRKGLLPDKRHVPSWTEWGVIAYMKIYPWAVKGWRKYVSLVVVLVVLVGGCVVGVKGWKRVRGKVGEVWERWRRGKGAAGGGGGGRYRRVGGEMALDDWTRDEEGLLWDEESEVEEEEESEDGRGDERNHVGGV